MFSACGILAALAVAYARGLCGNLRRMYSCLQQVRLLKTRNIKCIIGARLSSVVSQKLWKVCFRQAIIGAEIHCNAWLS